MILNVSGRTDIVAFYSEWFFNRYKEGFFDVRNPFHPKLVSRIFFCDVDAILFCTKNPLPILNDLEKIKKPILFQVTLTPYKEDIEPNVPNKKDVLEAIKKISKILGNDFVVVRYDPIFISKKYSLEYHKKAFLKLCKSLKGYVKRIVISFLDEYKNVEKNKNVLNYRFLHENDYKEIGLSFAQSAKENNIVVHTCFEKVDFVKYGFTQDACFSHELAYIMTGKKFKNWKARGCNCVEMVDVGVYNSCKHFCKYCYANYNEKLVLTNMKNHDKNSSLLIGHLENDDVIKERKS